MKANSHITIKSYKTVFSFVLRVHVNGRFLPSTRSAAGGLATEQTFQNRLLFFKLSLYTHDCNSFPQQLAVPCLKVRAFYTKIVIIQFLMVSFYHFHVASFIITMCKYILFSLNAHLRRFQETSKHFSSFIHALYSPCTGSNVWSRFYLFI